jgi:hypothetical protein
MQHLSFALPRPRSHETVELSRQPSSDLRFLFPRQCPKNPEKPCTLFIKRLAAECKRWFPPAWKGARTEIVRSWERFSMKCSGEGEISGCAVFRMNCWMFGNPDGSMGALPGDPEADQTF